MNKVLIIKLVAFLCVFNITESSERVKRQYGFPQNFYPSNQNIFGSRSSMSTSQGQFGANQGPFQWPNWNQQAFGGFQPVNFPNVNTDLNSRFGGDSDVNVKRTSTSCTYTFDGKKSVEKCESRN